MLPSLAPSARCNLAVGSKARRLRHKFLYGLRPHRQTLAASSKQLRGQARITESNVQEMLREVRMALLEADVALPVVRDFIARVKDKALGTEVVGSLNPGQALVGIVNRELASTMGEGISDINLTVQPPAVILMAGLQGAGKTTTTAKLAKHLIEKRKKKVLTVSADVYRPAAIEQLKTVTKQAGAEWFPSTATDKPIDIARMPRSTTRASTTSTCCWSTPPGGSPSTKRSWPRSAPCMQR
jgi:signal recognition particle GTPase